jgi:aryl-phospho-beta-D-glucosidase BglC (GH1 family)
MAKSTTFFTLLAATSTALAALPNQKIRGVNLGSLFIVEPWMSSNTWKSMGCGDTKSEWDCVVSLGQEKANAAFQKHWNTFITADDFDKMKSYGINTVRIPVGHWFVEETITSDEHWPRGGMTYLDKVADLAAARDIGVIVDLHGAPGVQVADNAFTGHVSCKRAPPPPTHLPHTYMIRLPMIQGFTHPRTTNAPTPS